MRLTWEAEPGAHFEQTDTSRLRPCDAPLGAGGGPGGASRPWRLEVFGRVGAKMVATNGWVGDKGESVGSMRIWRPVFCLVVFFLHERVWNKKGSGRLRTKLCLRIRFSPGPGCTALPTLSLHLHGCLL